VTIGAGSPVPTLPPGEAERSPPLFLPDTATGRALDSGPAEALVRPPASSGIRSLSQREPILNVPGIVSLLCGAMILIHAVRQYVLDEDADREVLLTFAFIPARFEGSIAGTFFPGGVAGDIWTFGSWSSGPPWRGVSGPGGLSCSSSPPQRQALSAISRRSARPSCR